GIDEAASKRFSAPPRDAAPPQPEIPEGPDSPAPSPPPPPKAPVEQHVLSGGGMFATAFSAAFPALGDGLILHACGVIPQAAVNPSVPIVFLHGAKDASPPLSDAVAAREAYARVKHPCVRLRVMRGFNDFPNPVRVSETIDFLDGMRDDEAAEVL